MTKASRPRRSSGARRTKVADVTLGKGHAAVEAYVVEPTEGAARAGILFLHWLGEHRSDRTQFLAQARELAALGVRCVLPAGRLPWARSLKAATLWQFSKRDFFIAPMSALELARAAPGEPSIEWYKADHAMRSAKARASRAAFLGRELGLA